MILSVNPDEEDEWNPRNVAIVDKKLDSIIGWKFATTIRLLIYNAAMTAALNDE